MQLLPVQEWVQPTMQPDKVILIIPAISRKQHTGSRCEHMATPLGSDEGLRQPQLWSWTTGILGY